MQRVGSLVAHFMDTMHELKSLFGNLGAVEHFALNNGPKYKFCFLLFLSIQVHVHFP